MRIVYAKTESVKEHSVMVEQGNVWCVWTRHKVEGKARKADMPVYPAQWLVPALSCKHGRVLPNGRMHQSVLGQSR